MVDKCPYCHREAKLISHHIIPIAFRVFEMFEDFIEKEECCPSCHRKLDCMFDSFIHFGTLDYKEVTRKSENCSSAEHKREERKKDPEKIRKYERDWYHKKWKGHRKWKGKDVT